MGESADGICGKRRPGFEYLTKHGTHSPRRLGVGRNSHQGRAESSSRVEEVGRRKVKTHREKRTTDHIDKFYIISGGQGVGTHHT